MVVWQGITAGGTVVPVQVNDEGEVIARGVPGAEGPQGIPGQKGDKGDRGLPGVIQPGDDVSFGGGEFTADVTIGLQNGSTSTGTRLMENGTIYQSLSNNSLMSSWRVANPLRTGGLDVIAASNRGDITALGAQSWAMNKAGITEDGELFFYSRGKIYKLVISGGNAIGEEFTPELPFVAPEAGVVPIPF